MQEIRNLTGLRGFAALSVVLLHVRYGPLADQYEPFAFIFQTQAVGVDVFFVLSGFILAYVHHGDFAEGITTSATRSFLWARLARIYPVHLFMLLVVAFVLPLTGISRGWGQVHTAPDLLANLLLIHAWGIVGGLMTYNQVSWTISAEWFAYLCFPLIAFATRAWRGWMFLALAALCILMHQIVLTARLTHEIWALPCLLLFTVGYCTFRFGEKLPDHWFWRVGGLAIGPLLWPQIEYLQYLLTAMLVLCLFKAGPIFIFANPVLVYLGKISYSLYMSHLVAIGIFRTLTGQVMQLRYEIPLTILVAAAIYHLIEEPMRNIMRSRGRIKAAAFRD